MGKLQTDKNAFDLLYKVTLQNLELFSVVSNDSIDLQHIFLSIEIYESIFEPFLTARLIIADTFDLYKNFPIVGGETVTLTVSQTNKDENLKKEFTFTVFKINKDPVVTRSAGKHKYLELFLCSNEMLFDSLIKISRKFNATGDEIVKQIIEGYWGSTKELNSSVTNTEISVNSNYWAGTQVIDYVARSSRSDETLLSDYLFFENLDGFVFKPMSELIATVPVNTVRYPLARDIFYAVDDVRFFKFNKYFDIMVAANQGQFGKTMYKMGNFEQGYNVIEEKQTFEDVNKTFISMGKNMLYDSNLFLPESFASETYMDIDIVNTRTTALNLINDNNNLVARFDGYLPRVAGDTLNFAFPSLDNTEFNNRQFDGFWLILGIRHSFSNTNEYVENVLISKNARFDEPLLDEAGIGL